MNQRQFAFWVDFVREHILTPEVIQQLPDCHPAMVTQMLHALLPQEVPKDKRGPAFWDLMAIMHTASQQGPNQ